MNMQNIMAQAQRMQKEMLKKKEEIEKLEFLGKSEWVEVTFNGKREMLSIKIDREKITDAEDFEILEDMIKIAVKDSLQQLDKKNDEVMGKFSGLNGLF